MAEVKPELVLQRSDALSKWGTQMPIPATVEGRMRYVMALDVFWQGASPAVPVAGYSDGSVAVFDSSSRSERSVMQDAHGKEPVHVVQMLKGTSGGILSNGRDGTVKLWDLRQRAPAAVIGPGITKGVKHTIDCASMAPSTSGLLAISMGPELAMIDTRALGNGFVHGAFPGLHTDDILRLRFHPLRPEMLLSCAADGLACFIDTSKASSVDDMLDGVVNVGSDIVEAVFDGPNSSYVCCTTSTHTVDIWNIEECTLLGRFPSPRDAVPAAASTSFVVGCHLDDGGTKACVWLGDNQGTIVRTAFGPSTGRLEPEKLYSCGHSAGVRCFCITDDRRWVFTGGEDGRICMWDMRAQGWQQRKDDRRAGGGRARGLKKRASKSASASSAPY